jgi:hypothetical protein
MKSRAMYGTQYRTRDGHIATVSTTRAKDHENPRYVVKAVIDENGFHREYHWTKFGAFDVDDRKSDYDFMEVYHG